ncbi:hypothetical protein GCM10010218_47380 [Streptomyces mashuensis]|uniref:Uncharacterized protein n=1 Tax=Streptomyces mashuensis TaxID=33904 RepID=A0A919B7H5_9ACTN|nr:hypothetical protein [Streptomyces mashuensis]GHF60466.1 hypothetical protein GCM10010218_47380 [Streptomyces mashuensis]
MEELLPDGWTIERVREVSGDGSAVPVPVPVGARLVVADEPGGDDYVLLRPDVILAFHGLCLVRHEGEWYMGHFEDDGSVICWSCYDTDFSEAVRGL